MHEFMTLRGNDRDASYARLNFAFVIAEFLGWLEIIRQEIVFITGAEESVALNSLIDAIKFQFTGETEWQGGWRGVDFAPGNVQQSTSAGNNLTCVGEHVCTYNIHTPEF